MRLRNGVAACAVSALAMVFSVQQGEHGPLVVYKLQVPENSTATSPAPQAPAASTQPRLRSGITRVPQQPATRSAATPQPVPSRAPRSLGTVVMPASALPPPQVTPVRVLPVPLAVPPAPLPAPAPAETAAAPAPLQPRVLGTVAVSDIEALDAYTPVPEMPGSQEVFHLVEDSGYGSAMINEDTGNSLTLKEVNDAAVWRRNTAERLREVPIAPRF